MPNKYYRRSGTRTASPKLANGLESITPRQSAYAADLARKLDYGNVTEMWHEYGFVERTMGGDKTVTPSKVAAARVIGELVERAKLKEIADDESMSTGELAAKSWEVINSETPADPDYGV